METPVQSEVTFYQDVNVTVTQSRFITHSKTYAMRNISSVYVFEIVKSRKFPILMVAAGFLMLFSDDLRVAGFLVLAMGIFVLFLIKNEFRSGSARIRAKPIVSFQRTKCISKRL